MCEYCGCRAVPAVRELMEEHDAIIEDAGDVRTALLSGDRAGTVARLEHLASHLDPHVHRENLGIFPVSVVTLGASGYDTVAEAHRQTPTFLTT